MTSTRKLPIEREGMFDLRIRKYEDPILRKEVRSVEKVGVEEKKIISERRGDNGER